MDVKCNTTHTHTHTLNEMCKISYPMTLEYFINVCGGNLCKDKMELRIDISIFLQSMHYFMCNDNSITCCKVK